MNPTASKSLLQFSFGMQAKIWVTKTNKKHKTVTFHPFAGMPPLGQMVCILACGVTMPTYSLMPNFMTIGTGVSEL